MSLVSIIVPAYNNAKYISSCIESVVKQTYTHIEIIVIDDASTDKTLQKIESWQKRDKRIKIIKHKANFGTMRSRIDGYQKSRGEYVFFLDGDDLIAPNTIEKLINTALRTEADVVKSNLIKYYNGSYHKIPGQLITETTIKKSDFEPYIYDMLYKTIYLNSMCAQLAKKSAYEGILKLDKHMIYGEDLLSNISMFQKIKSITFIPDELYIYRINQISSTNTLDKTKVLQKCTDTLLCYQTLYEAVDKFNIKNTRKYKNLALDKLAQYSTQSIMELANVYNYETFKTYTDIFYENELLKKALKPRHTEKVNVGKARNLARLLFEKKNLRLLYIQSRLTAKLRSAKNA